MKTWLSARGIRGTKESRSNRKDTKAKQVPRTISVSVSLSLTLSLSLSVSGQDVQCCRRVECTSRKSGSQRTVCIRRPPSIAIISDTWNPQGNGDHPRTAYVTVFSNSLLPIFSMSRHSNYVCGTFYLQIKKLRTFMKFSKKLLMHTLHNFLQAGCLS